MPLKIHKRHPFKIAIWRHRKSRHKPQVCNDAITVTWKGRLYNLDSKYSIYERQWENIRINYFFLTTMLEHSNLFSKFHHQAMVLKFKKKKEITNRLGTVPVNREREREISTWDSAMVRTIGRIIGCITTFLSSAQSGGRTWKKCYAFLIMFEIVEKE